MTNEELLAAVEKMIDARFADEQKNISAKFDAMQETTDKKIETAQKETIRQVKALLENSVEKQIQLLVEGHAQILSRLPDTKRTGTNQSPHFHSGTCDGGTYPEDQRIAAGIISSIILRATGIFRLLFFIVLHIEPYQSFPTNVCVNHGSLPDGEKFGKAADPIICCSILFVDNVRN